jgi:hypothetical protein
MATDSSEKKKKKKKEKKNKNRKNIIKKNIKLLPSYISGMNCQIKKHTLNK